MIFMSMILWAMCRVAGHRSRLLRLLLSASHYGVMVIERVLGNTRRSSRSYVACWGKCKNLAYPCPQQRTLVQRHPRKRQRNVCPREGQRSATVRAKAVDSKCHPAT